MYKKLTFLLAFCILSFTENTLSANNIFGQTYFNSEEEYMFGFLYKLSRPSRVYGVINSDPDAQRKGIKTEQGFGFFVNALSFEYSPIYSKGQRITGYYSFALNSPVNPYIGVSYIRKTNIYDKPTKRGIDGYDGIIGMEISYLKYLNPYFEFMPHEATWMFGVRVRLGVTVKKMDPNDPKHKQLNNAESNTVLPVNSSKETEDSTISVTK